MLGYMSRAGVSFGIAREGRVSTRVSPSCSLSQRAQDGGVWRFVERTHAVDMIWSVKFQVGVEPALRVESHAFVVPFRSPAPRGNGVSDGRRSPWERGFAHESPSFERSLRSAAVAEQRSRCAHVHCMSWRNDCLREAHALSGPRRTLTLAEWSSILDAML